MPEVTRDTSDGRGATVRTRQPPVSPAGAPRKLTGAPRKLTGPLGRPSGQDSGVPVLWLADDVEQLIMTGDQPAP